MNKITKLTDAILEIGTHINFEKPIQWAENDKMPIYLDLRTLFSNYDLRMLVADSFVDLIKEKRIECDMIAGVPTSGLAFAASVADKLNLPLVMMHDDKPYVFNHPLPIYEAGKFDAIASTTPWAIPYGIKTADERKLPFMYVRKEKKGYGLNKLIEGANLEAEQRVLLLDHYKGENYSHEANSILNIEDENAGVVFSTDIAEEMQPANIQGKKIVPIDDMISTGDKLANEIHDYRILGAQITCCMTIFNFGFEEAVMLFEPREMSDREGTKRFYKGCRANSLLIYQDYLERARDQGKFNYKLVKRLAEWRDLPFNWWEKKQKEENKAKD